MTERGAMTYPRTIHISFGGPLHCIRVKRKLYHFEMHRYCGPMPIRTDGRAGTHLAENHPFWTAVTAWDRLGRKVDENGLCVWEAA